MTWICRCGDNNEDNWGMCMGCCASRPFVETTTSSFNSYLARFDGLHTFQVFGDSKELPAKILHNATGAELMRLNKSGYGIYLCVNETNGKGRKASNVVRVRAVFADLDGVSPDKMLADRPHLVVESSKGKFHGYWFVHNFPLEGFRHVQEGIAYKYDSDPSVTDLPRVMRVPGFNHLKGEPQPVKIYAENKRPSLDYGECVELFPPKPVKKWSGKKIVSKGDFPQPKESVAEILDEIGWVYSHGNRWTRPGKDHGCSGEIQESGNFFCYTSSTPLEPFRSYDAAGLKIVYEFNGDAKKYVEDIKNECRTF